MFNFLRNKPDCPPLCQLDQLYKHTISKLPINEKIAYCERLLESSRFQLSHSCPKKDLGHFKNLVLAAEAELQQLRSIR
ncbi:hypothetical protein [Flagellimonas pelagia]|uniref:Uncharacterized protein n=1 Tax=Flagellimonas pelagia TaxID=2306998 RepID=A0A3A1NMV1_9FLAO|nr:hypothetical protein [Allomuricauda maritima]RIV46034.1 hypothetical protein D2V05_05565 [Allomuricauda maritima]TXJ98802.1 hypothetical protein FQ017_05520 [Allomuricauda maritima]